MKRSALASWIGCALLSASALSAADGVVGTMTVKGRPFPLTQVSASIQKEPEGGQKWLVVLVSDVPVAPADRSPERLAALAAAGKVRAVRVVWKEGFDAVMASPYHSGLAQSGRLGAEHPTINLDRYDDKRFEGYVKSKMLGQDWFFEAHIKADLVAGGSFALEEEGAEPEPVAPAGGLGDARAQKKRALGRLGYEYNGEIFSLAILDAKVEAVRLFLEAGMAPDGADTPDRHPLLLATTGCAYQHEAEAFLMVQMLLKAGAKVDAGAKDGITPLLNAAQHCEGTEIIEALLAAGANVNTRAPGGATPLLFANVMNRTKAQQVLRRAGARE
jgi:hypothetical protein